ncbi:MAG: hypothetical protein QXE31_04495 [Candidatus Woesearchaeota archaeon]
MDSLKDSSDFYLIVYKNRRERLISGYIVIIEQYDALAIISISKYLNDLKKPEKYQALTLKKSFE